MGTTFFAKDISAEDLRIFLKFWPKFSAEADDVRGLGGRMTVEYAQCRNVPGFSQEIIAAPLSRQTHGDRAGQRQVSPRHIAGAISAQIPQRPEIAVLAAVQSATCTYRTGLETRPTNRHAQPVLCNTCRSARCDRNLFQSLAKSQSSAAQIMRHYLRHYV